MVRPSTLTRLGFGVTGPHAAPVVARAQTVALVEEAVRAGVRVFDTGPMYGAGEAETRLGAALAMLGAQGVAREDLFLMTKARTWPMPSERADLAATPVARVVASLAQSLARLGTPYVDVLFLHGPRPEDLTPELMDALQPLRTEGRVRSLGVCGRGAEIDAALDLGGFDYLMTPLSRPRLERAAATGVGVFAIETLRGRSTAVRLPRSVADLWYLARAARDTLTGAAVQEGAGVRAALAMPAVCSVVVTTTRRAHLLENAREAGLDV